MKVFLNVVFSLIFVFMLTMTIRTSLHMSLFEAWPSYAANPWAMATLYDAYAGFLTFFVWVAYKENAVWKRLVWLILLLGLGNIATSLYVLIQLGKLKPDEQASAILWKKPI